MTPAQRALIMDMLMATPFRIRVAEEEAIRALLAAHDMWQNENESRAYWIKHMNDIIGYNNDDGFHSEPDPFQSAHKLVADRDRLAERVTQLEAALTLLYNDVQDYEPWQRPRYALDVARAALAPAASPGQTAGE